MNELTNTNKQSSTLPVINKNNDLSIFLANVSSTMIPLVPEMYNFVRPELKLGFQKVPVNVDQDAYYVDGGYALKLQKLNEIAQAAGVMITNPRVIEKKYDETNGRVLFIKHQVTWTYKSIDGSTKTGDITGEYSYLEDVEKFTAKEDKKKYDKVVLKKGEVNWTAVNQRRGKAGQLAESNAISRAINKALSKLKGTYSKEELSTKPFLVPCVIEDRNEVINRLPPDIRGRVQEKYAMQLLGITDELYESPRQIEAAEIKYIENEKHSQEKQNTIPASIIKEEGYDYDEHRPADISIKDHRDQLAADWKDASAEERTSYLVSLAKRKGKLNRKGNPIGAADVKLTNLERQIQFIRELLDLPDSADYKPEEIGL